MSLLGDVAVATCSPRHNARQVILKEVSLRPLEDGEGFLILMLGSQGHSERRVILMMILMGSNGGREVSAQTSPSLIKITLEARTLMQRQTQTHLPTNIIKLQRPTHSCFRPPPSSDPTPPSKHNKKQRQGSAPHAENAHVHSHTRTCQPPPQTEPTLY